MPLNANDLPLLLVVRVILRPLAGELRSSGESVASI